MTEKSKTVLIAGYYGYGNTGDEAILATMIFDLQITFPKVDICVISENPEETIKIHKVEAISLNDMDEILSKIKLSDLVIIGGGGLFHDYWGVDPKTILTKHHHGLAYYFSIALLASFLNKPLMLFSIGVGPLITDEGRYYTKAVCDLACEITVRDPKSEGILRDLGIESEKITVTADPSFRFQETLDENKSKKSNEGTEPCLGVAIRNWDIGVSSEIWEGQVTQAIDGFLDSTNGTALLIPFHTNSADPMNDLVVAERVHGKLRNSTRVEVLRGGNSLTDGFNAIAGCDVFLGMRMHSIIFALLNEVPAVGLVYDPKVSSLMDLYGIGKNSIPIETVNSQQVLTLLLDVAEQPDFLKKKLRSTNKKLKITALDNYTILRSITDRQEVDRNSPNSNINNRSDDAISLLVDSLAAREDYFGKIVKDLEKINNTKTNEVHDRTKTIDNLKREIVEIKRKYKDVIDNLSDQIFLAKQEIIENKLTLARKEAETKITITERENVISNLEKELLDIKSSRGWKLLWFLWEVKNFFFPKGSWLEQSLSKFRMRLKHFSYQTVHPARLIKSRRMGLKMSKHEFAFDKYKRSRSQHFSQDLSSLCLPGIPGLVSIILPVYNGEKLIREAIESVLTQSYRDFELIIINDGSEDDTGRILDKYQEQDKRITVIHQENRKLPASLSRGFNMAQGEFLTWTSHDNRLLPNFLQKMVQSLKKHPDWDMVYANQDIIDEEGLPLHGSGYYKGYQWPPGSEHVKLPVHSGELNTKANNHIGGAFLYRDRVHWLLGDYSPIRFTREDYDYWMRVNALLTLKHTNFQDSVYEYRFHQNSLTQRDEEFGITRDRRNLMVFDDFRRDFYLSPLLWVIEQDPNLKDKSNQLFELFSIINNAGHMILERKDLNKYSLPKLWMPLVYLFVSDNSDKLPDPPSNLAASFLKVLLTISPTEALPSQVSDEWDICLAYDSTLEPCKLKNNRQGWLISDDIKALFSAIDIRSRSLHLEKIEGEIIPANESQFKISVIICTYNRHRKIADTLRSLAIQTMDQAEYEVIVVNNNPDITDVDRVVNEIRKDYFQEFPSHIRRVDCPLLGLSHARNAGLSEAKGELLYFIDDDATAEPDTLDVFWGIFSKHPKAGVIGGHILFNNDEPLPEIWRTGWEKYWSQFLTDHENYTVVDNWWEYPWGANWCVRKIALLRVGGFRTGYGRRGDDFSGGEEIVAASLIKRLGYSIGIMPMAKVSHNIDKPRITLRHLKNTIYAGLITVYQADNELRLYPEDHSSGSLIGYKRLLSYSRLFLKASRRERQAIFIETYYFLNAQWRISVRKASDYFKHFRRPQTAK